MYIWNACTCSTGVFQLFSLKLSVSLTNWVKLATHSDSLQVMLEVKKKNNFSVKQSWLVVAWLRAAHRPVSSAKRNPANAVSFDTILPREAEALKGTPITVTSPGKAKPVSVRITASRPCFILRVSSRELSEHGCTSVSACMNESVSVKSASKAQSNFSGVSERLLTERVCCRVCFW